MPAAGASRTTWPADKVERWPIDRLIPYAGNARTHSADQVDQIAASIREWGWTNPVLVGEDNTLIAGHGRVLAARKLRISEVPVMVATGWSEAQKKAYAIAGQQAGSECRLGRRRCSASRSVNWKVSASISACLASPIPKLRPWARKTRSG